ncbi:hypothetical protein YC2023_072721 [Brassica napus]
MNTGQDEEPLPSTGTRGGDGTPSTAKTNHGRTNLHKGSNRRAKTGRSTIRKRTSTSTIDPSIRLSCMRRSGIFKDKDKLEDVKTKSIGEKSRRKNRARGNRSVPARTILSKTSSPGDRSRRSRRFESRRFPETKAGRSSEELINRRRRKPVESTETGKQKRQPLTLKSTLNFLKDKGLIRRPEE